MPRRLFLLFASLALLLAGSVVPAAAQQPNDEGEGILHR